MTEVKESTHGLDKVRATFVCYRDFADQKPFEIKDFTEDVDAVLEFIDNVEAEGGADTPEDVAGALRKVLDQPWGGANAYKQLWIICDAPNHGNEYHDPSISDEYPDTTPHNLDLKALMREFSWKGIEFSALKFNDSVDQMINIMQENYDNDFMRMTVMDLTEAVETESREEIDHMVAEYAMMDVQRMMMKPRGGF